MHTCSSRKPGVHIPFIPVRSTVLSGRQLDRHTLVTLFGHTHGAFSEIGTVGDKFILSLEAVVFNEDDFGFPRNYESRNRYRKYNPSSSNTMFLSL